MTNTPHPQRAENIPKPAFRGVRKIVNPVVVTMERLNFLFRQNGFTPIFTPSLQEDHGTELKKIIFNRDDIKNVSDSNYPLLLYNRTALVKSPEISNERYFGIVGPERALMYYTHGQFTLRMLSVFNSQEMLEEFEVAYLLRGMYVETLQLVATLPPVGILESLPQDKRQFIIDVEWGDLSDIRAERNNGKYEFSVASDARILTTFFDIDDPYTVSVIDKFQLNFYWDEELKKKESQWDNIGDKDKEISVTFHNDTGEKTIYPYLKDNHPDYEETRIEDIEVSLRGLSPYSNTPEDLDISNLRYGSKIENSSLKIILNSKEYLDNNIVLTDFSSEQHEIQLNEIDTQIETEDNLIVRDNLLIKAVYYDKYRKDPLEYNKKIEISYPVIYGTVMTKDEVEEEVSLRLLDTPSYQKNLKLFFLVEDTGKYFYYAFPSIFGNPEEYSLDDNELEFFSSGTKEIKTCVGNDRVAYNIYISKKRFLEETEIKIE